jgi:hypothetical protein
MLIIIILIIILIIVQIKTIIIIIIIIIIVKIKEIFKKLKLLNNKLLQIDHNNLMSMKWIYKFKENYKKKLNKIKIKEKVYIFNNQNNKKKLKHNIKI